MKEILFKSALIALAIAAAEKTDEYIKDTFATIADWWNKNVNAIGFEIGDYFIGTDDDGAPTIFEAKSDIDYVYGLSFETDDMVSGSYCASKQKHIEFLENFYNIVLRHVTHITKENCEISQLCANVLHLIGADDESEKANEA